MELVSKDSQFDQWLKEKEKKYKILNEHIVSVCHKYGLDEKASIKKGTIVADKSHKLAFCRNAKVKSGSKIMKNKTHKIFGLF